MDEGTVRGSVSVCHWRFLPQLSPPSFHYFRLCFICAKGGRIFIREAALLRNSLHETLVAPFYARENSAAFRDTKRGIAPEMCKQGWLLCAEARAHSHARHCFVYLVSQCHRNYRALYSRRNLRRTHKSPLGQLATWLATLQGKSNQLGRRQIPFSRNH